MRASWYVTFPRPTADMLATTVPSRNARFILLVYTAPSVTRSLTLYSAPSFAPKPKPFISFTSLPKNGWAGSAGSKYDVSGKNFCRMSAYTTWRLTPSESDSSTRYATLGVTFPIRKREDISSVVPKAVVTFL